ncbi:MAG: hypothetical protein J3Q66DRAFT_190688 [Benniella sp.]|nr:MAG: hypothetical protein J3Q66DRAFT_190688 [Benniella sp.]
MVDQPQYLGAATYLRDHSTALDVDPYFTTTPVVEWSLSHFYKTHDDHAPFINGLIIINHRESVDKFIRSYANAWVSFLSGETGRLHLDTYKIEKSTNLLSERINETLDEDKTKEPGTTLGKRGRSQDGERCESTQGSRKKNATHADDPFLSQDGDALEEDDNVPIDQEHGNEAIRDRCIIGPYDLSEPYLDYYEEAVNAPYDHNAFQDFLVTATVLFLGKEPTSLQRRLFGENFNNLREVMIEVNEQGLEAEEQRAVKFCQEARDLFRKAKRKDGSEEARKKLQEYIGKEEPSPLKELYEYAVKLPTLCTPMGEADQTSFILGMLRPIFDRPDISRLAYTATATTSDKNPDLFIRYKETVDIGVAEVSDGASTQKDIWDLCRTVLWSKLVLDEIVSEFDNTEDVQLLFFQVVGQTCTFYIMKRAGPLCLATELAKIKIAYTLSDILTDFEDSARDWAIVYRTFDKFLTTLKAAKPRGSLNRPLFMRGKNTLPPRLMHQNNTRRQP